MVNVVKILNHLTFMLISKPKLTCLPVRLQQRTPKFRDTHIIPIILFFTVVPIEVFLKY